MATVTYELSEWVTRPFSRDYSIIVAGNFSNPQLGVDTTDLLCFDSNANRIAIFATVWEGRLDDGTIVQGGPRQVVGTIITDHSWTHIVTGPFGTSGARVLFYDAHTGVGSFFGVQPNGGLNLIRTHTGWRTSWTHIIAGNFSESEGSQLLFYDAAAGVGEFYAVDNEGGIYLLGCHTGWRNSWHTIVAVTRYDRKTDNLLFYDKGAGEGQFYSTDGHGQISQLQTYTNWRQS